MEKSSKGFLLESSTTLPFSTQLATFPPAPAIVIVVALN
jgi:hypothetical protein